MSVSIQASRKDLTGLFSPERDFNLISSPFSASHMHSLMRVSEKVDEEFECFVRRVVDHCLIDPSLPGSSQPYQYYVSALCGGLASPSELGGGCNHSFTEISLYCSLHTTQYQKYLYA